MTVALVLLAYAGCAGTLGARALARARWTARAPLLGMLTCLAAGWSVVAAVGLAGLTLAVHATALGGGLSQLLGACVRRLRDLYATPGGATVAELGLVLAGAVVPAPRWPRPVSCAPPGGKGCGTRMPPGCPGVSSQPWAPWCWSIRSRPPTAWPAGARP